jgi:hypothetical protein
MPVIEPVTSARATIALNANSIETIKYGNLTPLRYSLTGTPSHGVKYNATKNWKESRREFNTAQFNVTSKGPVGVFDRFGDSRRPRKVRERCAARHSHN